MNVAERAEAGRFTKEVAAELGRKGGKVSAEARAARKRLSADLRAREKLAQAAEDVAAVLVDAALGKGKFDGLDPKEQAQFALKVLEYGVGRPRQVAPAEPPADDSEPVEDGLSFAPAEVEQTPDAVDLELEAETDAD